MKNRTPELTQTPTAAQIVEGFKAFVFSKANVRIRFADYGDPRDPTPEQVDYYMADINKVRRQTKSLKKVWVWLKNYPVELTARLLIETAKTTNTGFRFNVTKVMEWEYCVGWYGSIELRDRAKTLVYQAYQLATADDCKLLKTPDDEHALWLTYHFAAEPVIYYTEEELEREFEKRYPDYPEEDKE
jgi:hypothetical protein